MRFALVIPMILPALLLSQGADNEPVKSLIIKLGNANYQDREAAVKALRERPEAEQALRAALRSADLETGTRIRVILAHYEGRSIRELKALAKEGRIDEFIKRVAIWPAGKNDEEIWLTMRDLAHTLKDLHEKKGGHKTKLLTDNWPLCEVLKADRVTESTKIKNGAYFVRAREVDIIRGRLQAGDYSNDLYTGCPIVASATVRLFTVGSHVIFAGASVEIEGADLHHMLIVSCDDVILKCRLYNSIVIARGKVTITDEHIANRIIAGKSIVKELVLGGEDPSDCLLRESEPNPLGFIRWSEPPKQQAKVKQP